MAGATGVAAAATSFIPFVDLITVPTASAASAGLYGAARIAEQTGRGIIPKKILSFIKKQKPIARKILRVAKRHRGKGMAGSGISDTAKKILKLAGVGAGAAALAYASHVLNASPQDLQSINRVIEEVPTAISSWSGPALGGAIDIIPK